MWRPPSLTPPTCRPPAAFFPRRGRIAARRILAGAAPGLLLAASFALGAALAALEDFPALPGRMARGSGLGGLPGGTPSAPASLLGSPAAFGCRVPLRRDAALERSLSQLTRQPALRVGVFVCDPLSGRVASVDGERSFPAASTIKVPIAVELLRRADRGEIQLEEKLALRAEHIASGSGSLQYLPPGTVFTIRRLAELMIRRSDNTATNMIIARLGGADPLNRSFLDLGLRRTRLRRLLPDMEGRNRTSPGDLVSLLSRVSTGSLLSPGSTEILLGWMRRSRVKSLLPAGLGSGALCYNKTGDIPGALGDAGLVVLPGGRRYVAAVQVERPRNSARAGAVIRQISRAAYVQLL